MGSGTSRPKRSKSATSLEKSSAPQNLHEGLLRERNKRQDVDDIYEVLQVIGHGSLCEVYKIKRRGDRIGGSLRKRSKQKSLQRLLFVTSPNQSQQPYSESSRATRLARTKSTPNLFSQAVNDNDHVYALKVVNLKNVVGGWEAIDQLKNEIELLKTLDHPYIIKAFETFQSREEISIVMELCAGGNLYSRLPYTERQVARVVTQVLSAVNYMHAQGIVHRDIKMENIIFESIQSEAAIRLIDFGLSKKYATSQPLLKERVGTIYSMSPETMRGEYGMQADLWSIGVCTFTMLSGGDKPFEGKTPKDIITKVLKAKYSFKDEVWESISDGAKAFQRGLLVCQPERRMTAEEALNHEWLVSSMSLQKAPSEASIDFDVKQCAMNTMIEYASMNNFKRMVLNVIANRAQTSVILKLRRIFEDLDDRHNGTITLDQFIVAFSDLPGIDEDKLRRIFQKIDVSAKFSVVCLFIAHL